MHEANYFPMLCLQHNRATLMYVCVKIMFVTITVWGVNPQVNWDGRNAFVGARYPVGLRLDLCPHFIKIHKLPPFAVQEFSIF